MKNTDQITTDAFSALDVDCFDLEGFYAVRYPEIHDAVRYLSDYGRALEIMAKHFAERGHKREEICESVGESEPRP